MAGRELPEDVLSDILSLLPVKSLVRFRCVCKLWYALIENPSFISQHLSRASLRSKSDYLLLNLYLPDSRNYVLISHSNIKTFKDLSVNFRVPFFDRNSSVRLLGPSNGIVCLTDMWNHTVLCNPATREFRAIPMPQFTCPAHLNIQIYAERFGFDPKTRDYKVVVVSKLYDKFPWACDSTNTHVYNLSSNSWRQIEKSPCADIAQLPWSTTLFNGAFHWYASLGDDYEFIVSFHMSDEVFQKIQFPSIFVSPDERYKSLAVLNESLALILFEDTVFWHAERYFDIWLMREYGVKESWTRYCKIGPFSHIEWPLAFWENSEFLSGTRDGQLVSHNLHDRNVEHFQVYGLLRAEEVVIYSESLVSVKIKNVV